MSRFSGVCYDGPHEGSAYTMDRPEFRVAMYDTPTAVYYVKDPSEFVPITYGYYLWSRPLRKWVFRT